MIGSALLSVALAAGPADPEGPTPAPSAAPSASEFDLAQQAWQRRYRRLRVQTGVSWGLTAVGVVGMVIPIAKLASYHSSPDTLELDTGFTEFITIPMFAALTAAALVPAIVYTSRLVDDRRKRPLQARLHPGGVMLLF